MPIDAFLFGGRRATVVPLVREAFDWEHGVFLGATMSSETTAAAAGKVGQLRFDPFAMLPFCGYNMAEYFGHWLDIGAAATAPSCRGSSTSTGSARTTTAEFLWPGFGENSRVLAWIFRRCDGEAEAVDTPIGRVPAPGALDVEGLDLAPGQLEELLTVDAEAVKAELPQVEEHLERFGEDLPGPVRDQLEALKERLG